MEALKGLAGKYRNEITFAMAVFLASSLSFGAGWLANREFVHSPILIEKCSGN